MYLFQSWPFPARLLAAIGVFGVCLGLRLLILPVEAGLAFLTFYPGTAIVALLCGFGPTAVYIVVAGLVSTYIFVPPYWGFGPSAYVPASAFFLSATTILLVIHFFQRRIAQHTGELVASNTALKAREAELADAQRIAKLGSWSWDALTDVTVASPEACWIFGLDRIPTFAEQDGLLFSHSVWLELSRARQEALDGGTGYDLELPALHSDGHEIWVNSRAEPIRQADGRVTGLRGMVQDITERKAAESVGKSERFIRSITDAMPTLVAYWDKDLRCQFANKPYVDWWGRTAEFVRSSTLKEVMGESLFAINESAIRAALAGEHQHFERKLTKPDGSVGHVLANYVPDKDAHGNILGFIIIVTDIKATRLAEAELRLAASVYQDTSEGIMVTDAQGTILTVNPAFTQITGYPAQEAIGQSPRLLRSHRHDQEFHATFWQQISGTGHWQGEVWNRRKDGALFLAWQTISRVAGPDTASTRYVSVFHDTTDTWQQREDTRHLAFHDALTNLPNRALLLERIERQISLNDRSQLGLAVMFLDLDRFKFVNDTLGHATGDELLIEVAKRLESLVRQSDTVARLGGDEFVILLNHPSNREEVVLIAGRIIAIVNEPMELGGKLANVGTSIGIAMYPGHGSSAKELIKNADTAMYEAKHAGRNTYRLFAAQATSDAWPAN